MFVLNDVMSEILQITHSVN